MSCCKSILPSNLPSFSSLSNGSLCFPPGFMQKPAQQHNRSCTEYEHEHKQSWKKQEGKVTALLSRMESHTSGFRDNWFSANNKIKYKALDFQCLQLSEAWQHFNAILPILIKIIFINHSYITIVIECIKIFNVAILTRPPKHKRAIYFRYTDRESKPRSSLS